MSTSSQVLMQIKSVGGDVMPLPFQNDACLYCTPLALLSCNVMSYALYLVGHISLAILNRLSQFPSTAVGTNWHFLYWTVKQSINQSINQAYSICSGQSSNSFCSSSKSASASTWVVYHRLEHWCVKGTNDYNVYNCLLLGKWYNSHSPEVASEAAFLPACLTYCKAKHALTWCKPFNASAVACRQCLTWNFSYQWLASVVSVCALPPLISSWSIKL